MTYRYWFALQFWIVTLFHSCKELIHIHMNDFVHDLTLFSCYCRLGSLMRVVMSSGEVSTGFDVKSGVL